MCFSRNIHTYHFFLYMNDHFYVVYSADGQISISLKLKFAHNIAGIMDISHSFPFNLLMLTLIFLFKFSSFFFRVVYLSSHSQIHSDLLLYLPHNIRHMEINYPLENLLDMSTAFYVFKHWKWV